MQFSFISEIHFCTTTGKKNFLGKILLLFYPFLFIQEIKKRKISAYVSSPKFAFTETLKQNQNNSHFAKGKYRDLKTKLHSLFFFLIFTF